MMADFEEHPGGRLADEKGISSHKEDLQEETLREAAERGRAATDRYFIIKTCYYERKLI